MTAKPRTTVVTATYRSPATLSLTLQSLLGQTDDAFEAWVVGDGCRDNTEDVVGALGDPRVRWVNLPRNTGSQAEPNNEGMRRSRGRYVAFLGHDDLWFPWHLEACVEALERDGSDLVHTMLVNLGKCGPAEPRGPSSEDTPAVNRFVPPSSWVFRRELFDSIGPWRPAEGLAWPVDQEWLLRVRRAGRSVAYVPRLGVLKFPSGRFRGYDLEGEPPQKTYLDRMRSDAARLETEILFELAENVARQRVAVSSWTAEVTSVVGRLGRRLRDTYGRDRWPLRPIWRWAFHRHLKRRRKLRGLDSETP